MEKIYALMVTGKELRRTFVEASVRSFLCQDYPCKELVIINDGNYSLSHCCNDVVREIRVEKQTALGELRNISLSCIPKDAIWVQWDDDDWHHEQYLSYQYGHFLASQAGACVLKNEIWYDFRTMRARWECRPCFDGTIMMRKNTLQYPSMPRGEDAVFLDKLKTVCKCVVVDNPPHYYVRFVHGYNTWGDDHFEGPWLSLPVDKDAKDYLSSVLKKHYSDINPPPKKFRFRSIFLRSLGLRMIARQIFLKVKRFLNCKSCVPLR